MALDPYADSEAQFLAWIAGQGAPAATDPLALGPTPTPTTEEVPAGILPPEPAPAAQNDQWWPSSWLAGGDEAAKAMNAPQTPAVGPEPAGAPPREQNPLAAPQAELDKLPPPMFGPSPTPPAPELNPDEPGLGTIAAGAAREIALNSDPLRKDERGEFIDPDEASRDARLRAMPEADFQVYKLKQQQEADEIAKAKALDEARLNTQRAQANYAAMTKATEHAIQERDRLMAESKALAGVRIDRRDAFKNRSAGGKLLGVLQAVIGGLVAGRTGGPNQGLQMLLKEADDYAEDMRADLSRKSGELQRQQGLVSTSLGQAADNYRLGELARQAAYETVLREIDAQRQSVDPKGTAAIRYAEAYRGVKAAQAQAAQAFTERTQKEVWTRWKDAADIEIRREDLLLRANADARAAAKAAGAGGGGGGFTATGALDEKYPRTPEQLAVIFGIGPGDPRPTVPMSMEQYRNDFLGAKNTLGQIAKSEYEKGAEGRKVEQVRGGLPLFDIKGKPIAYDPKDIKADDASVTKLRNKAIGTQEMVSLLDEAMSVYKGWSSDYIASDENVKLKAIMGKLQLAAKKTEDLGAITESDVGLIKGLIGTDDFTKSEWKNVRGSVKQARANLIQSLRLEAQGLNVKNAADIDFKNRYEAKPEETAAERALKTVLDKGDLQADYTKVNPQGLEETQKFQAEQIGRRGMTLDQKERLDGWASGLAKPDEREFALYALARASKEAASGGVRDYATALLQKSAQADQAATPSSGGSYGGGTGLTWQP